MQVLFRASAPSWRWLLAHEVRLGWRLSGGRGTWIVIIGGALLLVLEHVAMWAALRHLDPATLVDRHALAAIGGGLFMASVVLSTTFGLAVSVVFERGDLDLLLSSPVPPSTVQGVRSASVGLMSVALFGFLWIPIANMGAWHGHLRMLLGYPVMLAAGLAAASVAMAATLVLVRALGLRRARVAAQVLGGLIGAALVIAMQAQSWMPRAMSESVAELAKGGGSGWLGPASPLTWPARALLGEPLAATAAIAACLALFITITRLTGGLFAQAALAGPEVVRRRADARQGVEFRGGLSRSIVRKELVLIARDPVLISKSLLQVLYLVPLFLILVKNNSLATILAPSVVVLAAGLAGNLAWITISGEESPDLLASAPVGAERVRWLKCVAALIPVAAVMAPFVAGYAWRSIFEASVLAACAAAACASSALMQVWTGKPGSGRDLKARLRGNWAMGIVETVASLGWALVCWLAIRASAWAFAALALALVAPVVAWFLGRRAARRGG